MTTDVPLLPLPGAQPPRSRIGRWFLHGQEPHGHAVHPTHPWYSVLWLTGVDYFSTLGYQPGIALLAAGALSPIATGMLIAITLLGALPVYAQVCRRSYAGQGSIAMLERLLPNWFGKLVVLVMLGFAATDFVITITLSAADAAQHAIENPLLHSHLEGHRIAVTLALLVALALVFLRGFREAIGVAGAVAIPYLVLNAIVIGRGLLEVSHHPELWSGWKLELTRGGDLVGILVASALIFPKLALGLSGFETGVSVMPLVSEGKDAAAAPGAYPAGRVRNTRKLLAAAALIMSVLLLGSSFVTTLLLPPAAYAEGGPAAGRALAYLAHELFGHGFGTVYDFVTIAILWFAGASAMAGLLNLIPRYLPRFGMAPRWVAHHRPLVLILLGIAIAVTLIFRADVEAQSGAYATGVLALILSASIAVALSFTAEFRKERRSYQCALAAYFWLVSLVFAYTFAENVHERPDGVIIAGIFIGVVLLLGAISRQARSTELRVAEFRFEDARSSEIWKAVRGKKVNLVPLRRSTARAREKKAKEIRQHYHVRGPLAFLHVELIDDRSEFMAPLRLRLEKEGDDYVLEIRGATAIANTIAYVSELIDPVSIFLGLTRQNLMNQSARYLFLGEGETGLLVYTILLRYWEWTPEDDVRPLLFLMSE